MDIAMTIPAKAKAGAGKTAAKAARKEGLVPAVIYGGAADPEMVAIDPRPIWKGLNERGFFAKVMALDVDGKQMNVLPRDVQFDRVTDQPIHVDFMRVTEDQTIDVDVPVVLEGEARNVTMYDGMVDQSMYSMTVSVKPADVPQQIVVYRESQCVRAARRIGFPVVVKPLDANHGRGVSINLTEDEQVEVAFGKAKENARGRSVLVESYIEGFDHRMLVVNGELVAVAKRVP